MHTHKDIKYLQVPYSTLHTSTILSKNSTTSVQLKQMYAKVEHLHLVNSYGLFRRMTGAEGRPEVIIEGSDSIDGPWKEYEFLYKPGNINNSLPFVGKIYSYVYLYIYSIFIYCFDVKCIILKLIINTMSFLQHLINLVSTGKCGLLH